MTSTAAIGRVNARLVDTKAGVNPEHPEWQPAGQITIDGDYTATVPLDTTQAPTLSLSQFRVTVRDFAADTSTAFEVEPDLARALRDALTDALEGTDA